MQSTMPTVGQIRQKARAEAENVLREHWRTRSIPVDPVAVARSLGTSVFTAQLGDDVFGMIAASAGGADIYLDRDQPVNRFRFTCAHEIGHYVDRFDDLRAGKAFVDKRSDTNRGDAAEIFANEFAGSLLMPEQELRSAVASGTSRYALSSQFGVSLAALNYRLELLGLS